jgi:hypothetical protein
MKPKPRSSFHDLRMPLRRIGEFCIGLTLTISWPQVGVGRNKAALAAAQVHGVVGLSRYAAD